MTDDDPEDALDAVPTDGGSTVTADDPIDDIDGAVERVEEIIERLESGEPGLAEATELREEGRALIERLRATLQADDGEVYESEGCE